jgi:hypothetical protein
MSYSVLIGCEESGTLRDLFLQGGFDAWSCDLKPTRSPGPHYRMDVRKALRRKDWDLFIVHPDCTYLTSSGLHWNKRGAIVDGRPRAELTEEALQFVREMLDVDVGHLSLENPQGCISTRIAPASQYVQPYEYGDNASKKTGLWLRRLPLLKPRLRDYVPPERLVCKECGHANVYEAAFEHGCGACMAEPAFLLPRWGNQTNSGQNKLAPGLNRARDRSVTYAGIGRAMVRIYGAVLRGTSKRPLVDCLADSA